MSEYNWREEREKFRPDFRKTPKQQEPLPPQPEMEPPKSNAGLLIAIIAVVVLLGIGGVYLYFHFGKTDAKQDSAAMLAAAAEKNKSAVGLVVVSYELANGQRVTTTIGTAWAFEEKKFATNAHVVKGITENIRASKKDLAKLILTEYAKQQGLKDIESLAKKVGQKEFEELAKRALSAAEKEITDITVYIVINGTLGKSYSVSGFQIHRAYGTVNTKFDPDVAVLTIKDRHDSYFKIAPENTLRELKAGIPVAFLGFPMENLAQGNVNVGNPIASMQTGIIVAVSDFELKDAGKDANLLIRHNLPAAGGASGSPIFNQKGEVVALLYAANMIGQISAAGEFDRAPSAAMINLGVRADLIEGMGEWKPIRELLK